MAEARQKGWVVAGMKRNWNFSMGGEMNNARLRIGSLLGVLVAGGWACIMPQGASVADQRESVLEMRAGTLEELYGIEPRLREHIRRAAGYAVFTDVSLKAFTVGTGQGYGVAVDNRTGEEVFMRMVQAGGGFGYGIQDFRNVFVFLDQERFRSFVDTGLEISSSSGATAEYEGRGAHLGLGVEVLPGVEVYQLTQSGLAASAMVMGTKYFQDPTLN